MVKTDFRRNRNRIRANNFEIKRDFSKGQQNVLHTDKSDPESFQLVRNMFHSGGNVVLRNGYRLYKDMEALAIGLWRRSGGNELITTVRDSTNSKIQTLNREDGTLTNIITGFTGQTQMYTTSLRGNLFATNGGDTNIHYYTGTSGTLAFNYGGGNTNATFLASDESRVWAIADEDPEQLLVFSNDRGTSAITTTTWNAGSSTVIDRAGIAKSKITNFTGLVGVGKSIVAFGRERTEVHEIPDFATNGLTTFPSNVPTIKASGAMAYDEIGIDNFRATVAVGNYCFFFSEDGILYRLDVSRGALKAYDQLKQIKSQYSFANAVIGYDQTSNLLFIQAKFTTDFDTTFVFNVQEENFAQFDNILATQWAYDREGVYFLGTDSKIYRAFESDMWTDNGLNIDWEVITQASYSNSLENYKKARELFLHTVVWEDSEIYADFIPDRGIDGVINPEQTIQKTSSFILFPFNDSPQSYAQGVYGGAGLSYNTLGGTERIYNNDKLSVRYARYEQRVRGSSSNKVIIKGIGCKYATTAQKIKNIIFNS